MDKEYFLQVLHRYRDNTATPEEQEFLIKYYDLFQSDIDLNAHFDNEQKEALKKEIRDAVRSNIDRAADKKIIKLKSGYIKVAAAAVVIVGCLISVLFWPKPKPAEKLISLNTSHRPKPNLFIVLPDGSKVVLSYGSKLSYASSFDHLARREVYLTGEGFFDIKHDNSKPFIVHTGSLETTVLGTAFNVKAIAGDKTVTVTVTRGKVKVSDYNKLLGVITPDQQITFNRKESNSRQSNVIAKNYTNWTTQDDLLFEDVTFGEAATLLEERFRAKIVFRDTLVRSKHFTSTFDKSASLDQALKSICEFNDAFYSYDRQKNAVTISSKSETK